LGVDRSEAAVALAQANATRLGLSARATIERGDWDAAHAGSYDLVLCNPPYIATGEALPPDVVRFEPASALFAGDDGLDDYRRIAPLLRLPAGGVACIEIGASQTEAASALFAASGFAASIRKDLAGRDRCLVVTAL
jgi:release factor glutamine methyltransferase